VSKAIRLHDYDRYICSLFVSRDVRTKIWGVLELGHELMHIPMRTSEEMVGLVRLKWWQEEIQRMQQMDYTSPTPLLQQIAQQWQSVPDAYIAADALCEAVAEHGFADVPQITSIIAIMRAYFAVLCVVSGEEQMHEEYVWLADIVARIAYMRSHASNSTTEDMQALAALWQKHTLSPHTPPYLRHLWLLTRLHIRQLQKYATPRRLSHTAWRLWCASFTFSLQKTC
jgi:hypothetical protein